MEPCQWIPDCLGFARMMRRMRNADSGFTFVELMVVIIILGVTASISLIALGNSHRTAIQKACRTYYQAAVLAIQSYQSDNKGALPASLDALSPDYVNKTFFEKSEFSLSLVVPDTGNDYIINVTKVSGNGSTLLGAAPDACSNL